MIKKLLNENLTKIEFQKRIDDMHTHDIAIEIMELEFSERERLYHFDNRTNSWNCLILRSWSSCRYFRRIWLRKAKLKYLMRWQLMMLLTSYKHMKMKICDDVIETLEDVEDIKEYIQYTEDEVGAYRLTNMFIFTQIWMLKKQ